MTYQGSAWSEPGPEKPPTVKPESDMQKDIIRRFGCCEKAEFTNCVCMYSFWCPDHGTKHVGTHD